MNGSLLVTPEDEVENLGHGVRLGEKAEASEDEKRRRRKIHADKMALKVIEEVIIIGKQDGNNIIGTRKKPRAQRF